MYVNGSFLFLGMIIGFSIAAPIGPVGILCIHRTLACGRLSGLATGLGAATADGIYAIVAAFGLTIIADLLTGHLIIVRIVGGAFLVYLGLRIFLSSPPTDTTTSKKSTFLKDYGTTFFFTLTNPLTILSFAGIFAALGPGSPQGNSGSAVLMVVGIIAGSVLWWGLLVSGTSVFGSRFNTRTLVLVNRLSGILIIVFGMAAFASSFV